MVESEADPRLLGRVSRRDLVTCLSQEVLGSKKMRAKLRRESAKETDFVELPQGIELRRVRIPDAFAGRMFDSLDLHGSHGVLPLALIGRDDHGGERGEGDYVLHTKAAR